MYKLLYFTDGTLNKQWKEHYKHQYTPLMNAWIQWCDQGVAYGTMHRQALYVAVHLIINVNKNSDIDIEHPRELLYMNTHSIWI